MSDDKGCAQTRLQVVTTGLMFLASGLVVFAGARGWYDPREAWAWWPLGFLFPAVNHLVAPPPQRRLIPALAWLGAAAVLILANLDVIELRFTHVVATVLVVVGGRMLYTASRGVEARR
jgi:hypothetical protein